PRARHPSLPPLPTRRSSDLTRNPALRLLDGAVVLLLISSLGAVLLAVTGINGTATAVTTAAFVDFFLTLFADGWFGVGVVGALVDRKSTRLNSSHLKSSYAV